MLFRFLYILRLLPLCPGFVKLRRVDLRIVEYPIGFEDYKKCLGTVYIQLTIYVLPQQQQNLYQSPGLSYSWDFTAKVLKKLYTQYGSQ